MASFKPVLASTFRTPAQIKAIDPRYVQNPLKVDDFENLILVRVAATLDQLVPHKSCRPIDEEHIDGVIAPWLQQVLLAKSTLNPGLALPGEGVLPIPPQGKKVASYVYILPKDNDIVVIDGWHRVTALRKLKLQEPFYWLFDVLHPVANDLPELSIRALMLYRNSRQPLGLRPKCIAQLKLAVEAAKWAYDHNSSPFLEKMLSVCVTKLTLDATHSAERTLLQQINRIVASTEIVEALQTTALLEQPLWEEADERTVSFLHALERFRMYKTASKIIHAAAETTMNIGTVLDRPLATCDVDRATKDRKTGGISDREDVQQVVDEVSSRWNLPQWMIHPWCLPLTRTGSSSWSVYLQQYRSVLKAVVLITVGSDEFQQATRKSKSMVDFPVPPGSHVWGMFKNDAQREEIDLFMKPARVRRMAKEWGEKVVEELKKEVGDLSIKIDGSLGVFKNKRLVKCLGIKVTRLLESSEEWIELCKTAGMGVDRRLPFVGDEEALPRFPAVDNVASHNSHPLPQLGEAAIRIKSVIDTLDSSDREAILEMSWDEVLAAAICETTQDMVQAGHLGSEVDQMLDIGDGLVINL